MIPHRARMVLVAFVASAASFAVIALLGGPEAALADEAFTANDARTWRRLATAYDIEQMLAIQLQELQELTKAQSKFSQGRRNVETIGRVIAMLGNVGTVALDDDLSRRKAAAVRDAGLALTQAAEERDFAQAEKLTAILAGYPLKIEPATTDAPADWTEIMPSATVMKQVSKISLSVEEANKLRGAAFRKESRKIAYHGLLLMYLALVEREHEPSEDWRTWCDTLLEGARQLAIAYRDSQQEKAKTIFSEMQHNCDACHAVYRG